MTSDHNDLSTDCLVIGAGPGGLIAATYLGRFRRPPIVIDGGRSRAAWIPTSHNVPGFPDGISGADLLARLRRQAELYGADIRPGRIDRLERSPAGDFLATGRDLRIRARRVILATGVDDQLPEMQPLNSAISTARVRLCPVCDGYEVSDLSVAVIGPGERAYREARFLTAFTRSVTLLRLSAHPPAEVDLLDRCTSDGFCVEDTPVKGLGLKADCLVVELQDGRRLSFDSLYVAMGVRPRASLAEALGATCSDGGFVETDSHQRTSVPGLYAVGDIVHELNQISVAAGHAAIAATDVHNALRNEDDRAASGRAAGLTLEPRPV
jgi:thioredoxin reductase (NADPH)